MITLVETLLRIASGPGAITAILCGAACGFLGWLGSGLSHGSTPWDLYSWAIRGFVAGTWLGFTPFAIWSLAKMVLGVPIP
jgi:hypothetical protein